MHHNEPRILATSLRLAVVALAFALVNATPGAASNGVPSGSDGTQRTTDTHTIRRHFFGDNECLRVTAAGVTTRNDGSPGHGTITLPPGPALGNIVWAGLYWDVYHNGVVTNAVKINGSPVAPVPIGTTSSPCWPESYATAYFADVTGMVDAGPNLLTGLDDSGTLSVANETPGASLVVVYRSIDATACEIIVMDGNDWVAATIASNVVPVTCGDGVPANLWFIGGDGQVGGDHQIWNGADLGDGDDFDQSDPIEPGGSGVAGWDTDLRRVVTGPPSVATVDGFGDCINWVATVMEVGVHPTSNCQPTDAKRNSWGQVKVLYR